MGLYFRIVDIRKMMLLANFDQGDRRHTWKKFFTQPNVMKQFYTPEERAKLEEMFDAVDAWDLTRYTENELWVMDKKIDVMLTTELVAEESFEEGKAAGLLEGFEIAKQEVFDLAKQEGIAAGKLQMLQALITLKNEKNLSDESLKEKLGLSALDILRLRMIM